MDLLATPVTHAAFAPFGALIRPPALAGERAFYTDWLGSLHPRPGLPATPRLHVNFVPETLLPHTVALLEKHPYSAQIFLPLDVAAYLVIVAPSLSNDLPDLIRAQAFLVAGTVGVVYRAGTWHASVMALYGTAHFAVEMWRNDVDDDVFQPLAEPLFITL